MSRYVKFAKMEGAANDFIVVDNRKGNFPARAKTIQFLCDRKRGIGSDGILLVEPSRVADFRMRFFNPDGGEVDMCGNGARCISRFAHELGVAKTSTHFETPAGIIRAWINGEQVKVQLSDPKGQKLNQKLRLTAGTFTVHNVNTGVPHAVVFVRDLERIDIQKLGAEIRYHKVYRPKGTNANFVKVAAKNSIVVRTYERGVEGETLACGTGVTASAIAAHLTLGMRPPIKITARGGDVLEVDFESGPGGVHAVTLKGPAKFVFEGKIKV